MLNPDREAIEETRRLASVMKTGLTNAADETMERLADLAARLLGATVGLVSLVDDQRQFFPGQTGLPAPLSNDRQTPLAQSLCRTVVSSNDLLQIDDTSADPRWADHGATTQLGVASYLGAPLVDADGRVLGALCAIEPTSRSWTAADRQVLLDLAFNASSELRARIAVTDANLARFRLEMMSDVSAALISSMDSGESIGRMLDVIVERFANWAFVYIAAADDMPEQILARHRRQDMTEAVAALSYTGQVGLQDMATTRSVVMGTRPSVILDVIEARAAVERAGEKAPIFDRLGIGPLLIVPMKLADDIVGALVVFGDQDRQTFDSVDVAMASDIARRAAMTFAHSRLYAREKRVAFELQHSLLPELPVVAGIAIDAVYTAAAHGVDVGGDWYDLIDVGDGSFIAVIGDVTGHSIRAAAAMGRVQTAVRIFATIGQDPAQILDRVAMTSAGLLSGLLTTCLVAHIRPIEHGSWTITVANAGHLPPVVVDPTGYALPVEIRHDPLLGVAPGPTPRSNTAMTVPAGSTLLLYTDGLIEHRREPIDESIARLVTTVGELGNGPIAGLCGRLVSALGPDGRDDIACIAIRF